ncbi:MAG: PIG-L family deacetylase [Opitutaceae bacterium]|nr:PIG-L family deacetylase [Opitutaceae bacterium]|tara:strand:+ start:2204 stop:3055 length:852 start_codon:yes stop_codon:yes gene_type:complete
MLNLHNEKADILVIPKFELRKALQVTTHLAIGAHQDDLEFMASEGILTCFDAHDKWFTGITVTDGRGSPRIGPYSNYNDEQMRELRRQEQRNAAEIGQYAAQIQLDYKSSEVKGSNRKPAVDDLVQILKEMHPRTIYLHQPADKHDTHVAVMMASIEALRSSKDHHIPDRIIGCEGWRGLDWLADDDKVPLDSSKHPALFQKLTQQFDSQISGGKRYDLAVQGRLRANATFFDSYSPDQGELIAWGIDLKPLVLDPSLSMENFIFGHLNQLTQDVTERIRKFS